MSEQTVDFDLMEKLFKIYKNQYVNERMTEKQNENLRYWHNRKDSDNITLSQIDHWLYESQIIPKILTIFDTGVVFSKLKIFSVDFTQFLNFIDQLSCALNLNADDIKLQMLEAKWIDEQL